MRKSQGIIEYFILIVVFVALATTGITVYNSAKDFEETKRKYEIREQDKRDKKLNELEAKLWDLELNQGRSTLVQLKLISKTLNYINEKTKKMSYADIKKHVVVINGSTTPIISSYDTTEIVPSEHWMGTGFVVRKSDKITYIITNAHVAGRGKYKPRLRVGDEYSDSHKVIYTEFHEKYDLALLIVISSLNGKEPIKGIRDANYEQRLQVVGHHLGRLYLYGEGVYAGKEANDRDKKLGLEFDVYQLPILYGNSGSPVFNQDGYVVGVIFAINRYNYYGVMDGAHGLAVPGKVLKEFIGDLL
ncbi:hypothetical protein LCGC14_0667060 [marine sediment metagenome]|uniref:Serine protease n=1 Tax=marine sediment metagenome TaxID=412755 RepID=A0A0F9QX27_9ZZZZ